MKNTPKALYAVLDRDRLIETFTSQREASKYRREMDDYLPDGAPHRVVAYVPRLPQGGQAKKKG